MDVVDILRELVARPSVNPMGLEPDPAVCFEERVSDWLEQFLAARQIPHERWTVAPHRDNVIARLDGPPGAPVLLFDAHQDTIPVGDMTIPPFTPEVRDGRLYGRGACDVKGGLAAMLAAVVRAAEHPGGAAARAATVLLSCTVDEELHQIGAAAVVDAIQAGGPSRLLARPDAVIVAEPTSLNVVVAHLGVARWQLRTSGVACHSSRPERGVNAIYAMAKIIGVLEDYAAELSRRPAHPLCGSAALSVGVIQGGSSVNIVPADCWIDIDRRVLPGEDNVAALAEVEAYVRARVSVPFEITPKPVTCPPLPDDRNGALAAQLLAAARSAGFERTTLGVPFGTHASRFDRAGFPAVVFGPGSIDQAHTKDEWIELADLRAATDILYRLLVPGERKE